MAEKLKTGAGLKTLADLEEWEEIDYELTCLPIDRDELRSAARAWVEHYKLMKEINHNDRRGSYLYDGAIMVVKHFFNL